MIRIVAENIVLFLLPTIVYIAFIYLTREDRPGASSILNDAPLTWLFVAGAILVVVTLATFGSVTGGKPGQVYTPPALKDGRIEPGHLD